MYVNFQELPDYARVWVYQASKKFTPEEKRLITNKLRSFCEGWNSHGNMMPTSFEIMNDQVLVLGVDESRLGASGCSIDSSVKVLKALEQELQINLTDQGKVSYKNTEEEILVAPALGIKSNVVSGQITPNTLVINPQIKTKEDLPNVWIPAEKSWLNKYFPN